MKQRSKPLTRRFRVAARNDVDGDRAGSFLVNLPILTPIDVILNWIQNPAKALAPFTNRGFNPQTCLPIKNKTTLKAFN